MQKKNNELIKDRAIRLEKDVSEADKSGHLLRYVWVGDMMVNAELVRQGYAMVLGSPPDIKYYDVLVKLQQEAQSQARGLWSEEKEQPGGIQTQQEFWGETVSKVYHYPSCKLLRVADGTQISGWYTVIFMSAEDARAHGYTRCTVCHPP